jgi:hypothetical protein
MKYALVCKNELREQGYRVAEIVDAIPYTSTIDHEWIECPDDVVADKKWFDPLDNTFKDFPEIVRPISITTEVKLDQPVTTGITEL